MRGKDDFQGEMFVYFDMESRIPQTHPLRRIKTLAEAALAKVSEALSKKYGASGRPSVPPERLLKASILMALYSVRSERLFCEMLEFNLLFRWFLDMKLDEPTFDPSAFTRLRTRFVDTDLAQKFFDEIVGFAKENDLLSSEHFTVDGTQIEAWASHKSFRPKTPPDSDKGGGEGDVPDVPPVVEPAQNDTVNVATEDSVDQGTEPEKSVKNEMVDFKGQKRCNDTHESTTDPDARLMRKGMGKEAKLCYGGHALMENRNGLLVDIQVELATATETSVAKTLLERAIELGFDPSTLGADKGYHTKDFVSFLREMGIAPHIAMIEGRKTPGLDGRTTRHASYKVSQVVRKRVEEIFGWGKSVGGLRKTRLIGLVKNKFNSYIIGAAYNLVRMANLLCPA